MHKKSLILFIHCALTLFIKYSPCDANLKNTITNENVQDFLGNRRTPVSNETSLLKDLNKIKLLWEFKKGDSYTSPVIKHDKLIYAHSQNEQLLVECLNTITGNTIWRYKSPSNYKDSFGYGNGPRGSAIISNELVYLHDVSGDLLCLNLDNGEKIWSLNTNANYCVPQAFFGIASTPLIVNNNIIVNVGVPKGPSVVAFNKNNGKEIWKTGNKWLSSYASPIVAKIHNQQRIYVFCGGKSKPPTGGLISIDPQNGKIDFEYFWRSKSFQSVNASTPILVDHDKIFISSSYKTGASLLKIEKDFSYKTLWESQDLNCHWMTPIFYNGYIYGIHGRHSRNSKLVCLSAKTGKSIWSEQVNWYEENEKTKNSIKISIQLGSLLKADEHFLCLTETGHLLWLDLNPKGYKILSKTKLFTANQTWCSPIISQGQLYIAQNTKDKTTGKSPRLRCYTFRD